METGFANFNNRKSRSAYLVDRFRTYLTGSVLDVGCDRAVMRDLLAGVNYVGVDIGGTPDIRIDLERTRHLPFGDGDFDCVVCSDVLEHLDNLHAMFDELVRVSRRYLVISLPNCWVAARRPIERGKGEFMHYGLQPERPVDRHKWFFSLSQAHDFFISRANAQGMIIKELCATEKPRFPPLRWARRLRYRTHMRYLNRYAHTLWVVLEKSG